MNYSWGNKRRIGPAFAHATAVLMATMACTACSGSWGGGLEGRLNGQLEDYVWASQENLWAYRDALLGDYARTIIEVEQDGAFLSFDDLGENAENGVFLVTSKEAPEGVSLGLLAIAHAESGGGLFYEAGDSVLCFEIRLPRSSEEMRTLPIECAELERSASQLNPDLRIPEETATPSQIEYIPVVKESGYSAPTCVCLSGSDCECPGG